MRYLIVHDTDADGLVSAWVTRNGLANRGLTGITLRPLPHSQELPMHYFTSYDRIIFVDLCPTKDQFAVYKDQMTVIDHHKTSQWIKGSASAVHDLAHAACMLCWMHFFPKQEAPRIVAYVEDRDIWRFALPYSKEVNTWIRAQSMQNIDDVSRVAGMLADGLGGGVEQTGGIMLEYERHLVTNKIDQFDACMTNKTVMHWRDIPLINVTENNSEVLHGILNAKNLNLMGSFFFGDGRVIISLRSRGGIDSSAIATKFGGGGHFKAAGFKLTPQEFVDDLWFGTLKEYTDAPVNGK